MIFRIASDKLDQLGDPLKALNEVVDWSVFEPILAKGVKKEKKTNAGRRGAMMPRDMTPNVRVNRLAKAERSGALASPS